MIIIILNQIFLIDSFIWAPFIFTKKVAWMKVIQSL